MCKAGDPATIATGNSSEVLIQQYFSNREMLPRSHLPQPTTLRNHREAMSEADQTVSYQATLTRKLQSGWQTSTGY